MVGEGGGERERERGAVVKIRENVYVSGKAVRIGYLSKEICLKPLNLTTQSLVLRAVNKITRLSMILCVCKICH